MPLLLAALTLACVDPPVAGAQDGSQGGQDGAPSSDVPAEAPAAAPTEDPLVEDPPRQPTDAQIRERIQSLSAAPNSAELAGDALDHARLALRRAGELEARRSAGRAERARQIAWAALALASKQIALGGEQAALRRSLMRREAAERRAAQARTALEQAIAQRNRLLAPAADEQPAPVQEPTEEDSE